MADDRRARIVRSINQFLPFADDESPLYARLARRILADDELLDLVEHTMEGQPPANMIFAAVHFLLLRGAAHPLAGFYRTVIEGEPSSGDPYPAFKDFCLGHRAEIVPLLETRRVQTNEVRRAALLLPGLALVAQRSERPLATVEVGTAAGLLTIWDRYRYDYGPGGTAGRDDAALELSCQPRGDHLPPVTVPERAWSAGIDFHPIDLSITDEADWLRALTWPDQVERMRRLEAAIELAKAHPPLLVEGDGIELVGAVASEAPDDSTVVVHHSFALNQVSAAERADFDHRVAAINAEREVHMVAIEWVGQHQPLELRTGVPVGDRLERTTLARVHHHGDWIEWLE